MEARRLPADHPDATALVDAMIDELAAKYGPGVRSEGPTARPEELSPPDGGFVVLYDGGDPVAGGGVKRLGEGLAEIKRMYVAPRARSRGLARRLLSELERLARELGYRRVRLDTGPGQPHAERLYRSAGYRELDDYNGNPYASYWGEKAL